LNKAILKVKVTFTPTIMDITKFKNILILLISIQIVMISTVTGYANDVMKQNKDSVHCILLDDFNESPSNTDLTELEEKIILNNKHQNLITKFNRLLLMENLYTHLICELSYHISEITPPIPRFV
jgi:hypothetical protein